MWSSQPWSDHHSEVYSAHGAGAAEERRRDPRERRRHCTVRKVMMKRIWRGWWIFWTIMIHDVDWTIVAFFWKQECLPRLKFSLFVTVWPEQIFLWHLIRFLLFVLPSISFECCLNFDTKSGGTLFDQCSIKNNMVICLLYWFFFDFFSGNFPLILTLKLEVYSHTYYWQVMVYSTSFAEYIQGYWECHFVVILTRVAGASWIHLMEILNEIELLSCRASRHGFDPIPDWQVCQAFSW